MSAEFDPYRNSYTESVDHAIAFARTDSVFFAELKACDLIALSRRHLGRPNRARVLDFGCGTGVIDSLIAPQFAEVVGVDVSGGLLDVAAEKNPGLEYRQYDGATIPYDDSSFDLAFAASVFHHIEPSRRRSATEEIARVVRPGGFVVVYEHNPLNPLTRLAVSRCEFDDDVELLSLRGANSLLRQCGLDPIESRYIAFFPWRGRVLRTIESRLARVPLGGQYAVAAIKPGRP
jgi:SAM-dependent methyltransferase